MNKDFLVVVVGPLIALTLADASIRTMLGLEVTPLDAFLRALFVASVLWWIWVRKTNAEAEEKFDKDPANPTSEITPIAIAFHLWEGGTVDWPVLCRLSGLNPIMTLSLEVGEQIDYGSIVVVNAFWGRDPNRTQPHPRKRSASIVIDKATKTMYVTSLYGDPRISGRGILHIVRILRDRGVAIEWIVGTHCGDNRLKDGYTTVIKSDLLNPSLL